MKIVKILLVVAFLAVSALYIIQDRNANPAAANEGPVIRCDAELIEISVHDDDSVILSGVTATDAQDGDLTGQVLVSGFSKLITDNTAKVTYVVFDSDDNMGTLTRNVRYTDYQRPRFSLDEPLCYHDYEKIELLDRLQAHDSIDGNITGNIRVSYTVPTGDPEIYHMDVQVTNSMGDTAWLTLPVLLLAPDREPLDVELDTYLIYLEQGDDFDPWDHLESAAYNGLSINRENISISGEVDTAVPGTYMLEYTCVYGSLYGTAVLTVVVE